MRAFSRRWLGSAMLAATALWFAPHGATAQPAQAAPTPDPILGTWRLDVAKSRYSPGPPPRSETRVHEARDGGVKVTITRVEADGRRTSIEYTAGYNSVESPISGSSEFDTIALRRINDFVAEATLMHAGKQIASVRRVVAKDGSSMTLSVEGTDSRGPFTRESVYVRVY
jgi:hypothetical protein